MWLQNGFRNNRVRYCEMRPSYVQNKVSINLAIPSELSYFKTNVAP